MQILVLGAAGFLGLHVVDALLALGVTPTAGRRKRTNTMLLRKRPVSMVVADLDDPASLDEAMAGQDVVVDCAGHYPRHSLDREGTLATGVARTQAALDAAARQGVRRYVYVSSTATVAPSAAGGPATEADVYRAPPGHGVYHDLKWHLEAVVRDERRLDTVIACPAGCIGPYDLRVGTSALLVAVGRGMDPKHPDGWVNLVDASDVGRGVARLAVHPGPPRRLILSASTWRLHALLEALADRYGVPRPSPALSDADAIAYADACEREGGRPGLSREIADLVVHGTPIDGSLAERTLGLRYRPLTDTLDTYDAWARRLGLLPENAA